METIAISIDEATLRALDRMAGRGRRARSQLIRTALHEFLERRARQEREERERQIYRRHRRLIARQAKALVREQAER
jgi:metal-responsive CopG/Arc/MetJ family transcriptional regulator